ncbi:MocR-like pyridoxine biosynthesis transcription factor PdxR [Arcobacter peruensis]|uniref:MocR-like pyridoxine biosynthesis transcription factor PdxR n=1 Tax=Arcobacter peruensis TaxID=2320140 RepID=UPI000F077621|nr:PLP-dependent aminotransferase family protein [Arcobacter peruensis]
MYILNPKIKKPLHIQLFEELKKDIISNYTIDQKLPSIRKISSSYNISKNTVETAYSQLIVEGFINSRPKSGYYVINTNTSNFKISKQINDKNIEVNIIKYDFAPAKLEKDSFPLKTWKRVFNKVIDNQINLGEYTNNQGELGLRVQIAKYLNHSRAVKCNENQIILGNGFADCMSLLAMILKEDFDTLAIEEPGYHVARKVFENHSYNINRININKDGIDIKQLENSKAKLVYITPSHQYPTGVSIPISNRFKILDWAKRKNAFIIEDDYDSELTYQNRPIPSLQGLDEEERVIYIGTFSKALSPSLRVSYLVLPNTLLDKFKKDFSYHGARVCLTTQKVLEEFIKKGHWDKHLRKIRTLNKKKHNLMFKLLKEKLKNTIKIESQGGGLAILINPSVPLNWDKLIKLSKEESLKLYFAKTRSGDNWQAIMMGFGGLQENEIEDAIDIFSQIWFKSII